MSYKDLDVWKMSTDLSVFCYKLTTNFPKIEDKGLISQMRRASLSIPSNIAEGNARSTHKDYLKHVNIARGSLNELETQMYIAFQLKYVESIDYEYFTSLSGRIGNMLVGLKKKLQLLASRAPRAASPSSIEAQTSIGG